jgi:hypothetical protein
MSTFDPMVFLAVFQEMLGAWLWIGVAAAAVALVTFLVVWRRDGGLRAKRLVWSQVISVLGGIAAILLMQHVTSSGFRDIGGPIDWVLGIAIFAVGGVVSFIATYAALGLARRFA